MVVHKLCRVVFNVILKLLFKHSIETFKFCKPLAATCRPVECWQNSLATRCATICGDKENFADFSITSGEFNVCSARNLREISLTDTWLWWKEQVNSSIRPFYCISLALFTISIPFITCLIRHHSCVITLPTLWTVFIEGMSCNSRLSAARRWDYRQRAYFILKRPLYLYLFGQLLQQHLSRDVWRHVFFIWCSLHKCLNTRLSVDVLDRILEFSFWTLICFVRHWSWPPLGILAQ